MNYFLYFLFTKSIGLFLNLFSCVFPEKTSELVFLLFTTPKKGKLNPKKLPQFLQESKMEKLKKEDLTFQIYIWYGNDTKILLIHGWESNSSRWEHIFPYLKATGSTIIAIDAPAHGLSDGKRFTIPQYGQFINETVQKYKPQYLIGHSIGGNACLYYQYAFSSDCIKKIITLGTPCDFVFILKKYVCLLSLNSKLRKKLNDRCVTEYQEELDKFSAQRFVQNTEIKGLIIHDVEDQTVFVDEGRKIAEAWKDARLIETKGLGHSLQDIKIFKEINWFLFH